MSYAVKPAFKPISVIHTAHGNVGQTKIQTACCGSIFRRALNSVALRRKNSSIRSGWPEPVSTAEELKYTERLAGAGIEPSVGRVRNSYDNVLAEAFIGLYKTD